MLKIRMVHLYRGTEVDSLEHGISLMEKICGKYDAGDSSWINIEARGTAEEIAAFGAKLPKYVKEPSSPGAEYSSILIEIKNGQLSAAGLKRAKKFIGGAF